MYILKIQGTKKIPDYIQIRDEDFTLVAYFRINNPRRALARCNLLDDNAGIGVVDIDGFYVPISNRGPGPNNGYGSERPIPSLFMYF